MTIKQDFSSSVDSRGRQVAEGYLSPSCANTEQCHTMMPERVIPIIFIPGIMGSNENEARAAKASQEEKQHRLAA